MSQRRGYKRSSGKKSCSSEKAATSKTTSGGSIVRVEERIPAATGEIEPSGVTVGKNSVVGVGAVVTKNVPPNSVAVVNPDKIIKSFS